MSVRFVFCARLSRGAARFAGPSRAVSASSAGSAFSSLSFFFVIFVNFFVIFVVSQEPV
jgi:hypothetical protein